MDIQQIIDEVIAVGHEAPERLSGLAEDPAATIEGIVGQLPEGISADQVVTGVEERLGGVDLAGIPEAVANFDVSSLTDLLPQGIGDAVGGAVGGFLGNLFGRK